MEFLNTDEMDLIRCALRQRKYKWQNAGPKTKEAEEMQKVKIEELDSLLLKFDYDKKVVTE